MTPQTQEIIAAMMAKIDRNCQVAFTGNKATVKSTDRGAFKPKLCEYLKKYKYAFKDVNVGSSFLGTELALPTEKTKITILYKPLGSGGSGAGSEITDLSESAQCWYAAAAFKKELKSFDDFIVQVPKIEPVCKTSATITEINKKLTEDWIKSNILVANYMKKLKTTILRKTSYEFHRGSPFVDSISKKFKVANDAEDRFFSNINKWNPADIWLVTSQGKTKITNARASCFAELNETVRILYKEAELVGVSLKKVTGQPHHEIFNYEPKSNFAVFKDFKFSADPYSAKDIYMIFNIGNDEYKMQLRSFGAADSWQGEIKGKNANMGKIGGGPLGAIFRKYGDVSLDFPSDVSRKAKSKDKSFIKDVGTLLNKHFSNSEVRKMNVGDMDADWLYSKYLGLNLMDSFVKLDKKKQAKVINAIVAYARSETDLSSVFVKIS